MTEEDKRLEKELIEWRDYIKPDRKEEFGKLFREQFAVREAISQESCEFFKFGWCNPAATYREDISTYKEMLKRLSALLERWEAYEQKIEAFLQSYNGKEIADHMIPASELKAAQRAHCKANAGTEVTA